MRREGETFRQKWLHVQRSQAETIWLSGKSEKCLTRLENRKWSARWPKWRGTKWTLSPKINISFPRSVKMAWRQGWASSTSVGSFPAILSAYKTDVPWAEQTDPQHHPAGLLFSGQGQTLLRGWAVLSSLDWVLPSTPKVSIYLSFL